MCKRNLLLFFHAAFAFLPPCALKTGYTCQRPENSKTTCIGASQMNHKFAIRDGVELVNGSYNWTRSAYAHNRENFVFHRNPRLVRAFREEFERLWESFA